jgi:hypothetical protein
MNYADEGEDVPGDEFSGTFFVKVPEAGRTHQSVKQSSNFRMVSNSEVEQELSRVDW